MSADPASTPRESAYEPHGPILDVSHGPAHGLAFALPWAAVLWLAIACAVMVLA